MAGKIGNYGVGSSGEGAPDYSPGDTDILGDIGLLDVAKATLTQHVTVKR